MIEGRPPMEQALLGTLFTWAVTALGAAVVFVEPVRRTPRRPLAPRCFLCPTSYMLCLECGAKQGAR